MKALTLPPTLVDQVHQAILSDIAAGKLKPGERLIQEDLADVLRVSRQPVQQALLLLRNQGVLREAQGRGLIVAPLDLDYLQHMYDIRSVIEGLAFRRAAESNAERAGKLGPAVIARGRKAIEGGSVAQMIAADVAFHSFVCDLSGNPLIAPMLDAQWTHAQRVMGEVLMGDEQPRDIWDQHEQMLGAVMAGDGEQAERLARQHLVSSAAYVIGRLRDGEITTRVGVASVFPTQ